jgi:hypothetical protein
VRVGRRGFEEIPGSSFVNFPNWLVTALVKWNIGHREAAQRYSAHGESAGNQQQMKAYYAGIMRTAKEVDFVLPYTTALRAYINE